MNTASSLPKVLGDALPHLKLSTTSTEISKTTGCPICACFPEANIPRSLSLSLRSSERKCPACGQSCGRPSLLDLFSGAGGAARGYQKAGFCVLGIDVKPQPRYAGCRFHQADALEYLAEHGREFDAIHASPPCQGFSIASIVHRNRGKKYADLIPPVRSALQKTGKIYVIENVPRAPLIDPVVLCGTMFGLGVFRHRLFESNRLIFVPEHYPHDGKIGNGKYYSVAGRSGRWKCWGVVHRNVSKGSVRQWRQAMGIDWMTGKEIAQAIPPAYTEFIGRQLLGNIR